MPPSPVLHGSTTASANAVATTASTAVPAAASASAPIWAAVPFCAATMPPREDAPGLRTSQFCVRCMSPCCSADRDRIDPVRVEGVIAGEPRDLVIRVGIGPYGVFRATRGAVAAGDLNRPVRGLPFVRAARVVLGRVHQVEPDILFRQIIDRAMAGLLDAQRGGAVGDRHPGEHDFDMLVSRHE